MNKEIILKQLEFYSKAIPVDFSDLSYGIISHPLTSSREIVFDGKFVILNEDIFFNYIKWRISLISNRAKSLNDIFIHINKPYRVSFLYFIKDLIDDDELTEVLHWSWTSTEFPHQEKIANLVALFKRFNRGRVMNDYEKEVFENLPDKIKIFRGLQGDKAKVRGLSWTLDFDKAKWFANRWGNKKKVIRAEIAKKDIFYYTDSRAEKEVVVNPRKLKNVGEFCYEI